MGPSVAVLESQYFLLRGSLSTLIGSGATPDQISLLKTEIVKSRTNYWAAASRVFHDDDPAVEALVSELNTIQLSLDATIQHLGKVAEILTAITKAVDVGSKLITKAVVL